ncbi:hypothetical protein ACTU45_10975 [Streptomyces sp. 24-1644]|uniref:hypothetical protein n=1 Tax=Streptomyces sp. 24-1644 TaxID=3457315 RepID=UPI003FA6A395
MASTTETLLAALRSALADRDTVSIRGTLIDVLGRAPSKTEISAGSKAARKIAEDGDAVLISLLPGQAGPDAYVAAGRGGQRRASNYLTVDTNIVKALPCRVELATEEWDAVIDEGMRLTQQRIESDPMLSAFLPGWKAVPRAERRDRLAEQAATT